MFVLDSTLPDGWKSRKFTEGNNEIKTLLSPANVEYRSTRTALKGLIKNGAPAEEIETMRKCLSLDGWQQVSHLPNEWRFKSRTRNFLYLTETGDLLTTHVEALQYMKKRGSFSAEQIKNLEKFTELRRGGGGSQPTALRGNSLIQPKPIEGKSILIPTVNIERETQLWKYNETLPKGWKMNLDENNKIIRSPEGNNFLSRLSAYKNAIKHKKPLVEIQDFRKCLVHEGWNSYQDLPAGWIFKRTKTNFFYITESGEEFRSHLSAFQFAKLQPRYKHCLEELKHFAQTTFQFIKSKEGSQIKTVITPEVNIADHKTIDVQEKRNKEQDKTVPLGWKTKEEMKDGKLVKSIVSPKGLPYQSRRLALWNMIKKGFSKDMVEEMRVYLVHEGWKQFSLLPEQWRFRRTLDGGLYVTTSGVILKNKDVLNFVTKSKSLTEKEFKNLEIFIQRANKGGVEFERFLLHTSVLQVNTQKSVPQLKVKSKTEPEKKLQREHIASDIKTGTPSKEIRENTSMLDTDIFSKLCPGIVLTRVKPAEPANISAPIEVVGGESNTVTHDIMEIQKIEPRSSEEEEIVKFIISDLFSEIVTKYSSVNFLKKLVNLELGSYPSRLNQLKHLVEGGSSNEKIHEVFNLLKSEEGWKEARYLPKNWITMKNKGKAVNINVISTEGHLFKSYKAAIQYMMNSVEYDENDIDHFKLFPDGNENRRIDVTKLTDGKSKSPTKVFDEEGQRRLGENAKVCSLFNISGNAQEVSERVETYTEHSVAESVKKMEELTNLSMSKLSGSEVQVKESTLNPTQKFVESTEYESKENETLLPSNEQEVGSEKVEKTVLPPEVSLSSSPPLTVAMCGSEDLSNEQEAGSEKVEKTITPQVPLSSSHPITVSMSGSEESTKDERTENETFPSNEQEAGIEKVEVTIPPAKVPLSSSPPLESTKDERKENETLLLSNEKEAGIEKVEETIPPSEVSLSPSLPLLVSTKDERMENETFPSNEQEAGSEKVEKSIPSPEVPLSSSPTLTVSISGSEESTKDERTENEFFPSIEQEAGSEEVEKTIPSPEVPLSSSSPLTVSMNGSEQSTKDERTENESLLPSNEQETGIEKVEETIPPVEVSLSSLSPLTVSMSVTSSESDPSSDPSSNPTEEVDTDNEQTGEPSVENDEKQQGITNNIILDVLENIKNMLSAPVVNEATSPEVKIDTENVEKGNEKKRKISEVTDNSLRRSKRMSSICATEKIMKNINENSSSAFTPTLIQQNESKTETNATEPIKTPENDSNPKVTATEIPPSSSQFISAFESFVTSNDSEIASASAPVFHSSISVSRVPHDDTNTQKEMEEDILPIQITPLTGNIESLFNELAKPTETTSALPVFQSSISVTKVSDEGNRNQNEIEKVTPIQITPMSEIEEIIPINNFPPSLSIKRMSEGTSVNPQPTKLQKLINPVQITPSVNRRNAHHTVQKRTPVQMKMPKQKPKYPTPLTKLSIVVSPTRQTLMKTPQQKPGHSTPQQKTPVAPSKANPLPITPLSGFHSLGNRNRGVLNRTKPTPGPVIRHRTSRRNTVKPHSRLYLGSPQIVAPKSSSKEPEVISAIGKYNSSISVNQSAKPIQPTSAPISSQMDRNKFTRNLPEGLQITVSNATEEPNNSLAYKDSKPKHNSNPAKSLETATPTRSRPSYTTPTRSRLSSATPNRSLPTSATSTRSLPTSATPTRSLPTSSTPSRSLPASATPTRSLPASATPTRSLPTSVTLTRSVPTSETPTSSLLTSATPTRSLPTSATSTRSLPISATTSRSPHSSVTHARSLQTSATNAGTPSSSTNRSLPSSANSVRIVQRSSGLTKTTGNVQPLKVQFNISTSTTNKESFPSPPVNIPEIVPAKVQSSILATPPHLPGQRSSSSATPPNMPGQRPSIKTVPGPTTQLSSNINNLSISKVDTSKTGEVKESQQTSSGLLSLDERIQTKYEQMQKVMGLSSLSVSVGY